MSKKCPDCGSLNVEEVFDNESYCKDCFLHCATDDLEDASVFDHITQNEEVLAEEIVYPYEIRFVGGGEDDWKEYWTSPLIENFYPTRNEAIAATIEELKKEWKK